MLLALLISLFLVTTSAQRPRIADSKATVYNDHLFMIEKTPSSSSRSYKISKMSLKDPSVSLTETTIISSTGVCDFDNGRSEALCLNFDSLTATKIGFDLVPSSVPIVKAPVPYKFLGTDLQNFKM